MTATTAIPLTDDPHAREIFATEAAGFFLLQGNVSITFATARFDHTTEPGSINRRVVGRVAMSVPAAQALCLSLFEFLKSRGLDPAEAARAGATAQ
jgi:hypothetical protein